MDMNTKTDLFNKIFYYAPVNYKGEKNRNKNVYDAMGKHILEKYYDSYLSQQDFKDLMVYMNIKEMNNKGLYPYRCRNEYYFDWH